MLFNSFPFLLLFLPLTLAGFFGLGRRAPRSAAAWLTLMSIAFYGWWNVRYVPLLVGSIAFNYAMGLAITRARAREDDRAVRWWLTFAVAADLALLGYYKYAGFFVENAARAFGETWTSSGIILPLGISFFTFTQIAFLVDVSRQHAKEYSPVHFGLFVSYFPHLIAGPILHHKEMMPQFADPSIYRARAENFSVGLTIFAIGLFKKTVLADNIAPFVSPVFNLAAAGQPLTLFDAWGGALAYTCQLYFDFSGYSDMAIGLSRLFGVQLPINFNSPYKASSIIDFWRRWHITLSRFLRDYVYIALGGNRKGSARRYTNLLLTMLLGGLWHGAGWTFIAWGGLHGIYLAVNQAFRWLCVRRGWSAGRPTRLLAHLLTFVAVVIGWVFFRASSLDAAIGLLRAMAGLNGVAIPSSIAAMIPGMSAASARLGIDLTLGGAQFVKLWAWTAALLVIAFSFPNTQQFMSKFRPGLASATPFGSAALQWQPSARWAFAIALAAAVGFLSLHRPAEFLYYQF